VKLLGIDGADGDRPSPSTILQGADYNPRNEAGAGPLQDLCG